MAERAERRLDEHMSKRSRVRILLMLAILALSWSSGCSGPRRLAEISRDNVPDVALQYAEGRNRITNLVWRASYEQGGYTVSVNTHDSRSAVAPTVNHYVEWIVCQEAELGSEIVLTSRMGYTGDTYAWQNDKKSAAESEDYIMFAVGWAHDKRAHTVVGTTAVRDRQFEGAVVNGFWFLVVTEQQGAELIEKVMVRDSQGNAIRSF